MKKANKKGFTIVELVIVIAVIAILAAVLIPTFTSVVEKANESKAMQEAKNTYEAWLADNIDDKDFNVDNVNICITSGNYKFHVIKGQFDSTIIETESNCSYKTAYVSKGNLYQGTTGETAVDLTYLNADGSTITGETTGNQG